MSVAEGNYNLVDWRRPSMSQKGLISNVIGNKNYIALVAETSEERGGLAAFMHRAERQTRVNARHVSAWSPADS